MRREETRGTGRSLCALRFDAPAQPLRCNEVGEGFFAVDEDDRDSLPIASLELVVAGDVHLLELEVNLRANA